MHQDLKPDNFLFANKKENSILKAIDFGLCVFQAKYVSEGVSFFVSYLVFSFYV